MRYEGLGTKACTGGWLIRYSQAGKCYDGNGVEMRCSEEEFTVVCQVIEADML